MSAILVLLALLSLATLAARRGYAAFVAHIVTTPLLIAVGVAASPANLALLSPSTLEALEPALRVAVAWQALLIGMRGIRPSVSFLFARDTLVALAIGLATWAFLAAMAYAGLLAVARLDLGFEDATSSPRTMVGAALLLGGLLSSTGLAFAHEALAGLLPTAINRRVLFLARHDEVMGAFALCAAVAFWPLPVDFAPVYEQPALAAAIVVGLGVVLGLAQLLSGGARMGGTMASLIALIGLTTFGAGLSVSTHLPGAAIAFFFGAVLALQGRGAIYSRKRFIHSERPVRLVVLVLIGASLGFQPGAVLLGVGLAFARLLAKAVVRLGVARERRAELPICAVLGSAGATLPFALSFALTRPTPVSESEILLTVVVCVAVTDLFTLIAWRRATAADKATGSETNREINDAPSGAPA